MTFGSRTRVFVRRATAATVFVSFGLTACGGDSSKSETEPTCLDEPADADCTAVLYGIHGGKIAPTFQDVFDNTLKPTCGASYCHSGDSPQAGLKLDDIDTAYTGLLATNAAGEVRVKPGDVQCGKVIVRLESVDKPWSMPPGKGAHLDDKELCAIRHWIKDGANK